MYHWGSNGLKFVRVFFNKFYNRNNLLSFKTLRNESIQKCTWKCFPSICQIESLPPNEETSIFLLPIFFATQNIGGAKELAVLLWLSGDKHITKNNINNELKE